MSMVMNKLNELMNFSYVSESVSKIAYEMTKELRVRENRFNENRLLQEELQFECENFLYDIKKYPEVKLENALLNKEDIILERFNKKSIIVEGKEISFYENKEDSNIIIFKDPLTEELMVRYNNNFIKEKNEFVLDEKTDLRKEKVTEFLIKENACAEIFGLDRLLEGTSLGVTGVANFLLQENALVYVTENYNDLKEFKPDCELAYNEIIVENKIIPVLSYIDVLTEDVVAMYSINAELKYNNNYQYTLNKIYEEE